VERAITDLQPGECRTPRTIHNIQHDNASRDPFTSWMIRHSSRRTALA